MSLDIGEVIDLGITIAQGGLSAANFGSAMIFDTSGTLNDGEVKTYNSINDVSEDFDGTNKAYLIASVWFSQLPKPSSIYIYGAPTALLPPYESATNIMNEARKSTWWFYTFWADENASIPVYSDVVAMQEVAAWCEANSSFFFAMPTSDLVGDIRDAAIDTDISSILELAGFRFSKTIANKLSQYAGVALATKYATVDYDVANSTITGEYKALSGVFAEELTSTEIATMKSKNCAFYTGIESKGSTTTGNVIQTRSHSSFSEYCDDVINIEAWANAAQVGLLNFLVSNKKLSQDTSGQQGLINIVKSTCETFIENGTLGARNYISGATGEETTTRGYEITTSADDILDLTQEQRTNRESAPIVVDLYRAGAIHVVKVNVNVL